MGTFSVLAVGKAASNFSGTPTDTVWVPMSLTGVSCADIEVTNAAEMTKIRCIGGFIVNVLSGN